MPTPIRTQIKQALFTRLLTVQFSSPINNSSTWLTTSRRLVMFNDLDPSVQPGMFLVQHRERYSREHIGTPPKIFLNLSVWCFARTGGDVLGDDVLDLMTEGIESVITSDDPYTNELTFGGLCTWCKIDREDNMYIRDPGDIDNQALLILPFEVLIPTAVVG